MDYLTGLGLGNTATARDISEDLKLGTSSTRRRLLNLLNQGIVKRVITRTNRGQDLYGWSLTKPRRRARRQ